MTNELNEIKELLGPKKDEAWRKLAERIDAKLVDGEKQFGKIVVLPYENWELRLDVGDTEAQYTGQAYTRLSVPIKNASGFRFSIYREGPGSTIAKLFGMQDLTVGHKDFDREFIIKGNDRKKLKLLFREESIRKTFQERPDFHLTIYDDNALQLSKLEDNTDLLVYQVAGAVVDLDELVAMFELMKVVLKQLESVCDINKSNK